MSDDGNEPGSGLGALGWYQMGRWSAEADQESDKWTALLSGTTPVARADYNYVVSLCHRLGEERDQLETRLHAQAAKANEWLRELKTSYDQLKERADRDAAALAELTVRHERLQAEYDALDERNGDLSRDIVAGRLVYRKGPNGEDLE